jgi:hypothetical protein
MRFAQGAIKIRLIVEYLLHYKYSTITESLGHKDTSDS